MPKSASGNILAQDLVDRLLAAMPERGMPEIVRERDGFRQVFVEPQGAGQRPGDLRDFQRVGQAGAV